MPTTPQGFAKRVDRLRADLVDQGRRVQELLESAFDAVFKRDEGAADRVIAADDLIDRVDVDIERAAVQLLTDATREGANLEPRQLRDVLMMVKINNELERAADAACSIAERVDNFLAIQGAIPETFRVMANSVVGLVRDVNRAFERADGGLARVVLQSEDCVEAFKAAILRDCEERLVARTMPVDFAFALHEIASQCERVADYCSNIAEQVIYAATGAVVRHQQGHWVEVPRVAS
ncbi:MAG: phosphate signaling complex PhoU family protein [Phycisphaerales bacterium]